MRFIDLHCDTAYKMLYDEKMELYKNEESIDIEKLKKGDALGQTFALFIEGDKVKSHYNEFNRMYERLMAEINKNSDYIKIARNYEEYLKNKNEKKISAFLSIEEGEAIEGDINKLHDVYSKGIRLITLTWNFENSIGYPNCRRMFMNKGLKKFGIEVVEEMNRLGMLVDVSHLSDGGFYDVAKYSKNPFIATHSNARSICNHSRNLSDDMIKILANKGGVMGLNFCNDFLNMSKDISMIEDMILHIKHIRNIGGVDVLALGSDFDGIDNEVEFKDCSNMGKLADALSKHGFKEEEIEKIFYKNAERIIKDVIK